MVGAHGGDAIQPQQRHCCVGARAAGSRKGLPETVEEQRTAGKAGAGIVEQLVGLARLRRRRTAFGLGNPRRADHG